MSKKSQRSQKASSIALVIAALLCRLSSACFSCPICMRTKSTRSFPTSAATFLPPLRPLSPSQYLPAMKSTPVTAVITMAHTQVTTLAKATAMNLVLRTVNVMHILVVTPNRPMMMVIITGTRPPIPENGFMVTSTAMFPSIPKLMNMIFLMICSILFPTRTFPT